MLSSVSSDSDIEHPASTCLQISLLPPLKDALLSATYYTDPLEGP